MQDLQHYKLNLAANPSGRWYELKPEDGKRLVIPQRAVLNFGGKYADLLEVDPKSKLEQLALSQDLFRKAISTLYSYLITFPSSSSIL